MYDELKRQGQLKASRAEGKAEGKAEGVELAKTAINMLKDGVAIDQICKETSCRPCYNTLKIYSCFCKTKIKF